MDMKDRISTALKQAMRDKAADRLSTLRLINAAIKDREIAARGDGEEGGVGDAEVLAILGKMAKQRQESVRAYEEGGRLDLAESERAEIAVIEEFLPPRHGQGDGRAEGQVYRPDGFRPRRPDGQGPAEHVTLHSAGRIIRGFS